MQTSAQLNTAPIKRKYHILPGDTAQPALRKVSDLYYGKTLLKRLQQAVTSNDEITIYGDYDADGITSVYILYSGLNILAPGRVHWFVNNRFDDGYSITVDSMKKCLSLYPSTKTIITCDNGINAADAVDYAMAQGITVLVTDHHVQTIPLRGDCPAVDEKAIKQTELDHAADIIQDECCGAELARRVIEELYENMNLTDRHRDYLDGLYAYSGLATVADVVPMNQANHAVGRRGIKLLQKEEGIWGLLKEEFIPQAKRIHWDTIGFNFGPLLNAGSRMTGEATAAVNMLLSYDSGDEQACRATIRELVELNKARKELAAHDDEVANGIIEADNLASAPFILVWSDQFSEGVNGLTAAHITEQYRVPCAVLSPTKKDPNVYKGSARSVEGANLIELLQKHADLIQAGGHAMAAGLSIKKEDLKTVRELLCADMKGFQSPPEPEPDYAYEASSLTRQNVEFYEQLVEDYEPFGPGFEEPCLEFTGRVNNLWQGKGRDTDEDIHAHFPMGYSADGVRIQATWWLHLKEAQKWYAEGKILRCRGKLEYNEYTDRNGYERQKIVIVIGKFLA